MPSEILAIERNSVASTVKMLSEMCDRNASLLDERKAMRTPIATASKMLQAVSQDKHLNAEERLCPLLGTSLLTDVQTACLQSKD